jgi:hypothetical protein
MHVCYETAFSVINTLGKGSEWENILKFASQYYSFPSIAIHN